MVGWSRSPETQSLLHHGWDLTKTAAEVHTNSEDNKTIPTRLFPDQSLYALIISTTKKLHVAKDTVHSRRKFEQLRLNIRKQA